LILTEKYYTFDFRWTFIVVCATLCRFGAAVDELADEKFVPGMYTTKAFTSPDLKENKNTKINK